MFFFWKAFTESHSTLRWWVFFEIQRVNQPSPANGSPFEPGHRFGTYCLFLISARYGM